MSSQDAVIEDEVKEEQVSSPFALLFELEFVAVATRRAAFDILASLLKENNIDLKSVDFSRYCLHPSPNHYISNLLQAVGGKKLRDTKLISELNNGIALYHGSSEAELNPGLSKLLDLVQERGVQVGVLSSQDEASASALLGRLGFDLENLSLFAYDASDHPVFPRADMWLKVTKSLSRSPRNCLALVSSSTSAKSALSSGMRCIGVPDEFTAFQDFGGADAVLETFEDEDLAELVDLVFPAEG